MPVPLYVLESLFPFQFQDACSSSYFGMLLPISVLGCLFACMCRKACFHFIFGMPVPVVSSGCLFPCMWRKAFFNPILRCLFPYLHRDACSPICPGKLVSTKILICPKSRHLNRCTFNISNRTFHLGRCIFNFDHCSSLHYLFVLSCVVLIMSNYVLTWFP